MPAYLIADIDVHDPQGYEEYRKLVAPTVQKYKAKYLARGGKVEVLEGQWAPRRVVIAEFESMDSVRKWYHSEDYRPAKAARQKASRSNFIIAESVAAEAAAQQPQSAAGGAPVAYLISEVEITDPKGYEEYRGLAGASLDKYGGKFLVRGGKTEVLEGSWNPKRLVVCRFDNLARLREWYDSGEYRKAKEVRQRTAKARIMAVEGV
jgi:uncharacterized protein (DUF1330 family)